MLKIKKNKIFNVLVDYLGSIFQSNKKYDFFRTHFAAIFSYLKKKKRKETKIKIKTVIEKFEYLILSVGSAFVNISLNTKD